MKCPRCPGTMLRDRAGDISCYACGYELIRAVPVGIGLSDSNRSPSLPVYHPETDDFHYGNVSKRKPKGGLDTPA